MRALLLTVLISLGLSSQVQAKEVVFNATPLSRVTSSAHLTNRETLNEREKKGHPVLITKKGKNYFWASQKSRPLKYEVSGAFHIFIDTKSGSYIKIFDSELLPGSMEKSRPRYKFKEHMTIRMESMTYWGTAGKFEP